MKTFRFIPLAAFSLFLLAYSCKKGDDTATLHVTPKHHTRPIDSCKIYIKYNATDSPANNAYDDSAKCVQVAGVPVATFSGLKKGNYFLYGYGWDPQLTPPRHVKGGYAYPIQEGGEQSIDLAVSED